MPCADKYDLKLTDGQGVSHGLVCDWDRGGSGLTVSDETQKTTRLSTKGEYGVKDANDYMRIIQSDWSQGSGQETYDREVDSPSSFYSSRFIDVGTIGQFGLSPSIERGEEADTLPVCATGVLDADGNPVLFVARATGQIWYTTGETWQTVSFAGTDPTNNVTCFASDGDYMYAAMGGSGVWRGRAVTTDDAWEKWSASTGITHLAFASGILYGAKGSVSADAQLGTCTGGSNAWAELSPAASTAINAYGATFGLVASGNYVYWGITNGVVTKVYKALFAGGTNQDTLQEVCSFPSGFIGGCMYAYLGTIYVGGHFDGELPETGLGAVYAIVGDTPALLSNVGTDRSKDNRVRTITAYERSLYFLAANEVWRWDLVSGGYSHWSGPVTSGELYAYTSIDWVGTWDFLAATDNENWRSDDEPQGSVIQTNGARVVGTSEPPDPGYLTLLLPQDSSFTMRTIDDSALSNTDEIDDEVGTTVALTYKEISHAGYLYFGVIGSEYQAHIRLSSVGTKTTGTLYSGQYKLGEFYNVQPGSEIVVTLCSQMFTTVAGELTSYVRRPVATAYVDGVLAAKGTAQPHVTPSVIKQVWCMAENPISGFTQGFNVNVVIDQLRWAIGGAYEANKWISIGGAQLACMRDDVWLASTADGTYRTSAVLSTQGELTSSRSAGNMPTIDKYFHAIVVQLKGALRASDEGLLESVAVDGYIDGNYFRGVGQLDDETTLVTYLIGRQGRNISYKVSLGLAEMTPGLTEGPLVTDVSVLFTLLPKSGKVYSYYVRCWKGARSNHQNGIWDEDPVSVSDWLEETANTIVTVSRPGRDDFVAKFEGLEYLEAPPSLNYPGREGVYRIVLRRMD